MWVALAIIAIILLAKPEILSGNISVFSSASPAAPSNAVSTPSSKTSSKQAESESNGGGSFLNPAMNMMIKQTLTQVKNVVETGTMKAPVDPSTSLLTMFAGDIHVGGSIGSTIGASLPTLFPSALGGLGFGLGFAGMALGEIIGAFFEDENPLSKAQQYQLSRLISVGIDRVTTIRNAGHTDQEIMTWISQHPGYWFLLAPYPANLNEAPSYDLGNRAYYPSGTKLYIYALYSESEKEALDNWAFSNFAIENVGGEGVGVQIYQRGWAEVEGCPGGWLNSIVDLSGMARDYSASIMLNPYVLNIGGGG